MDRRYLKENIGLPIRDALARKRMAVSEWRCSTLIRLRCVGGLGRAEENLCSKSILMTKPNYRRNFKHYMVFRFGSALKRMPLVLAALVLVWLPAALLFAAPTSPRSSEVPGKPALIIVSAYLDATATDKYVSGLIDGLRRGGLNPGYWNHPRRKRPNIRASRDYCAVFENNGIGFLPVSA